MAASLRMRSVNAAVRLLIRRRSWGGDDMTVARRARRLFGSPRSLGKYWTRGLEVKPIVDDGVRGEWLLPEGAGEAAILYIHGGGFVSCSPRTHRPVTAALARLTGSRVFSVDYRLAPEHRYPAAIEDVLAGYKWLLRQGAAPDKIAVAGDSAGGGLVLSLLVRARDAGLPLPACGVCFSPWTDLAATFDSVSFNDGRCSMFRKENAGQFAAAYLGGHSPLDPDVSPVRGDLGGLPPLLFQVGSDELLLDDSRVANETVRRSGGESTLEIYEGAMHAWQLLDGIVPEARTALRSAAHFILAHLGR